MSSMQITANSICSNKSLCVVSKSIYPPFHARQSRSAFVKLSVNASSFGLPVLQYKHHKVGLKYQHIPIVSLFGSKGKEDSGDGGSPWKAFDKVVEDFKGRSVEDILRQQIENKEFYDGGDGGKRPPMGGGGSGGSRGDSSGGHESEDGMGETLQVVLATIGFIFMYIYIISGEEMGRLAKDYIKYLFGGSKSVRLKRTMAQWRSFYQRLTGKKQCDEQWMAKAILDIPTLGDDPDNCKPTVMDYIDSKYPKTKPHSSSSSYESDSDSDESQPDGEEF